MASLLLGGVVVVVTLADLRTGVADMLRSERTSSGVRVHMGGGITTSSTDPGVIVRRLDTTWHLLLGAAGSGGVEWAWPGVRVVALSLCLLLEFQHLMRDVSCRIIIVVLNLPTPQGALSVGGHGGHPKVGRGFSWRGGRGLAWRRGVASMM